MRGVGAGELDRLVVEIAELKAENERLRRSLYECIELLRAGSAEKWRVRDAVARGFDALNASIHG